MPQITKTHATRVRLIELSLVNFKGVKQLRFSPDGGSAVIKGRNATGKTTLADAYSWLLWGDDSRGQKTFSPYPIGEDGQPIHKLITSVGAKLDIDGVVHVLSRSLSETWKTSRGESEAQMTGRTTAYQIDLRDVGKYEFDNFVANIGPSWMFRASTDPLYIQGVSWDGRRDIVMAMAHALTTDEIIARTPSLEPLVGKMVPDIKTYNLQLKGTLSAIDKRMKYLPGQAYELQTLSHGISVADAEKKLKEYKDALDAISRDEDAALAAKANTPIAKKRDEIMTAISKAQNAIDKIKIDAENVAAEKKRDRENRVADMRHDIDYQDAIIRDCFSSAQSITIDQEQTSAVLNSESEKIVILRADYIKTARMKPDEKCPYCGQPFPPEKREELTKEFNRHKAEKLASISAEAEDKKKFIDSAKKHLEDLKNKMIGNESKKATAVEMKKNANEQIEQINNAPYDPLLTADQSDRIDALNQQIYTLNAELLKIASGVTSDELDDKIVKIRELKGNAVNQIATAQNDLTLANKWTAIEQEIRDLAVSKADTERMIDLVAKLEDAKVRSLEDEANSKFALVHWRLFTQLLNGNVTPSCDATVDGVPFNDLNHGMQIKAGLDIIHAISTEFDFSAPCWIDNAEAVNVIDNKPEQSFELYVTDDAELVTENEKAEKGEKQ